MAAVAAATYRVVHACTIEDALRGPLRDSSDTYDAVLLMDVLEHLVDPEDGVRLAVRI